jgi:hypothetical protein
MAPRLHLVLLPHPVVAVQTNCDPQSPSRTCVALTHLRRPASQQQTVWDPFTERNASSKMTAAGECELSRRLLSKWELSNHYNVSNWASSSTERTYVRGLQELIDIYIKPAAAQVNLLGGVSSTKDTIIPAAERKIVFSGLDSLFSFHKDIFLPALELAANPVLRSQANQSEQEMEGILSANAARGIARTFVSHAAFMRMYSTYIK